MISRLNEEQILQYRELWAEVFHDDEAFLSFFFGEKAWFAVGILEGERLLSAMTYVPYRLRIGGRSIPAAYLVGLVTREEARGRGYAYQLMNAGEQELAAEGIGTYLLYPAIPYTFYTRRGGFILDERIVYTLRKGMSFSLQNSGKPVTETTDLDYVSRVFDHYNSRFAYATERTEKDWKNRMQDISLDGGVLLRCGDAAALAVKGEVAEIYGPQEDTACLCNELLASYGNIRFSYAVSDPLYRRLPDARGALQLEPHAVMQAVPGVWETVLTEEERKLLTRTDAGKPDGRIYDDY
ncbi:MAG: GNAT family N-acetyltransferase [Clostridia bacterium]|nr:GNAT family N-acetyltransferase [Clostridia bacterium]